MNWVRMNRYRTRVTVNRAQPTSGYAPVAAIDPGPDGVRGTTDDRPWTVYERIVPAGTDNYLTNLDNGEYYDTIEVNSTKRFANGDQIIVGWSRTDRHLGDNPSFDPNQLQFNGANRPVTNNWTFKLLGTYSPALGSRCPGPTRCRMAKRNRAPSVSLRRCSSIILRRLLKARPPVTVEPSGAYYLPNIALTNIRLEKKFRGLGHWPGTHVEHPRRGVQHSERQHDYWLNTQTGTTTDNLGNSCRHSAGTRRRSVPRIARLGIAIHVLDERAE